MIDDEFYHFYFNDEATKHGIHLDKYRYPLTNKKSKDTLNSAYFSRIFKSEIFRKKFVEYIETKLLDEYK